jgi:lipid II:glycine glycyltransferase (peptidoglycan interpeptide bridge formation enzyme)
MQSKDWNKTIAQLPRPHLLQTWQWAKAKASFGWSAHYRTWESPDGKLQAAAQILERTIKLPLIDKTLCMHYVPKGPLLTDWADPKLRKRVTTGLHDFAKERGAFFVKIDPDLELAVGLPADESEQKNPTGAHFVDELKRAGWRFSNEQVQMRNTMLIDLTKTEDELLAAMKQKTRYNVRLAGKKGVTVREGNRDDFPMLYKMYAQTALRDKFVIRSEAYYLEVWETFFAEGLLVPLIAEVEGQVVSGLMLFIFGEQAWYIYGMSSDLHRRLMPNYLLQWEAILRAKAAACQVYDLWGAPDDFNASDPMWGVYRFKKGLAAFEARHIGAWDLPLNKWIYFAYSIVWPRIVSLMQWRGHRLTRTQSGTGFGD